MRGLRLGMMATVLALLALTSLALCGFQGATYPLTLCGALELLGTAAVVNVLLGAFISALVEYWPVWEGLAPKLKRPVILGFCLVVPVASLIVRSALCGALVDQDSIYLAFMAGVAAFTGSQFAHIPQLPSR